MTKDAKEEWATRVLLVLMTLIVTSLGQSLITGLTSDPLAEMNRRLTVIETQMTLLLSELGNVTRDVSELKQYHTGRE